MRFKRKLWSMLLESIVFEGEILPGHRYCSYHRRRLHHDYLHCTVTSACRLRRASGSDRVRDASNSFRSCWCRESSAWRFLRSRSTVNDWRTRKKCPSAGSNEIRSDRERDATLWNCSSSVTTDVRAKRRANDADRGINSRGARR